MNPSNPATRHQVGFRASVNLWARRPDLRGYGTPELTDALALVSAHPDATKPLASPARTAWKNLTAELARRRPD